MSTFSIIKRSANNFWHVYNNGAKDVNFSDFEMTLDAVSQTVNLQMKNGANVPQSAVSITDIIVIDETDLGVDETFTNVEDLRVRLVELAYTPYLGAGSADSITGLIEAGTNVTITGTGTLADPYVVNSSGGGGAVDSVNGQTGVVELGLQEITEQGRTYTETIGDFTYTFNIFEDFGDGGELLIEVVNNVTNEKFSIEGSCGGGEIYFDDVDGNRASFTLTNNASIGQSSSFGGNSIKIPKKTSGSGEAIFQPPNNKAAGNYTLAITDDVSALLTTSITNGDTTHAPNGDAVFDALALKADIPTGWTAYGGSSTIVGFSSLTTQLINYIVNGKELIIQWDLEGTSNSQQLTFTIPQTTTAIRQSGYCSGLNNTSTFGGCLAFIDASTSIVKIVFNSANYTSTTTWTNTGTKRCFGTMKLSIT